MPPSHPVTRRLHLALRAAVPVALSTALVLTACASGTSPLTDSSPTATAGTAATGTTVAPPA